MGKFKEWRENHIKENISVGGENSVVTSYSDGGSKEQPEVGKYGNSLENNDFFARGDARNPYHQKKKKKKPTRRKLNKESYEQLLNEAVSPIKSQYRDLNYIFVKSGVYKNKFTLGKMYNDLIWSVKYNNKNKNLNLKINPKLHKYLRGFIDEKIHLAAHIKGRFSKKLEVIVMIDGVEKRF